MKTSLRMVQLVHSYGALVRISVTRHQVNDETLCQPCYAATPLDTAQCDPDTV